MVELKVPHFVSEIINTPFPRDGVENLIRPATTAVPWFGNLDHSSIATVGINPSWVEFFEPVKGGNLFEGDKRRLATQSSLAQLKDQSKPSRTKQIVLDCNAYFKVNPYNKWFKPLDELMKQALNKSYYDGSACHIDLLPWATDEVWGRLDRRQQVMLIDSGRNYLEAVLQHKKFDVLLLNGRTVTQAIQKHFDKPLKQVDCFTRSDMVQPVSIFAGKLFSTRCLAWTANIQSYRGRREPLLRELAIALKRHI